MGCMPLIGISGSIDAEETKHYVLRDYLRAVLAAGGVPVLLSPDLEGDALESCLAHLNGLLLAGGNDISPRLFGGLPIEALGEVNPLRDAFEWRLIAQARARQMPVLGICRGIQAMNAALGGTLYQDLASQYHGVDGCAAMKHQQTCDGRYPSHRVCVAEGTLLHRVLGVSRLEVNSFHHQAVWKVAPCLRVNATAEDGVTEGVECPELPFFLGVQWHPERVHADDARAAALFAALVRAARAYRMGGEDA